ncbi:hypothetical protein CCDG5_2039 [[Clostridium] cellulosi]|jgi:hypothetical protein|uniref:DUF3784 domain-containing protein n=1 Tax=[Clostridium] cellulosi TaxID=29343 RepID=A0A078KMX0_9FIRM|nr:hypothetical protein CCDG5_2039 [[Clostridium] cellulosi]
MDSFNKALDILIMLTGIYMFYWAFSGKGSIYKTDYIKKALHEKYKKMIKWFCIIGGALAVITGGVDYVKLEPYATILYYLLCVCVFAAFIAIFIFIDKSKIKMRD